MVPYVIVYPDVGAVTVILPSQVRALPSYILESSELVAVIVPGIVCTLYVAVAAAYCPDCAAVTVIVASPADL